MLGSSGMYRDLLQEKKRHAIPVTKIRSLFMVAVMKHNCLQNLKIKALKAQILTNTVKQLDNNQRKCDYAFSLI